MPRLPRDIKPLQDMHTIFRSVDNSFIFGKSGACTLMFKAFERMIFKHQSRIYAWVGMSNHQHIFNQAPPKETQEPENPSGEYGEYTKVGDMFRDCFSIFARNFNKENKRVGGVIRDRTKTVKVFDPHQAITLLIYIFLNPVRAGIVKHPKDYFNHNFAMYAYGPKHRQYKDQARIFSFHPAYLALGLGWKTRRAKFLWLVEKALKTWGLQRFRGISASHGLGRGQHQIFYEDFVRFSASWIPIKFGIGPDPPPE